MWHSIEEWFNNHMILAGGALAFITSILRVWNTKKNWQTKILDSLLCMSMTVGLFYGINYFHEIPQNVALCIGSVVGYLGTEQVKDILLNRFSKDSKNEDF